MLVSMTSFPYQESRMTTWDFIIALFYHIDRQMHDIPKHPEAHLWPSEVATLQPSTWFPLHICGVKPTVSEESQFNQQVCGGEAKHTLHTCEPTR
jgi:hypothetical protein